MKGLIKVTLFFVMICAVLKLNAQDMNGPIPNPSPNVLDGIYIQENVPTKKLVPYEYIREADAIWSKRLWRTIDLRQKMNFPLYYPHETEDSKGEWILNDRKWSLWTVIRKHIVSGDLTIYSPYNPDQMDIKDGYQFKYPITPAPGKSFETDSLYREILKDGYLGKKGLPPTTPLASIIDGSDSTDLNGNYVYGDAPMDWYTSKDIVQYRIKEDWVFDKERSQMDQRIIGIAPVVYRTDDDGNIQGYKELFWLYFPQCRYVFQNFFVFNPSNDSRWMSFDDLFWKRKFASTIYRESEVHDRKIETYRHGINALLKSEKIKNEIFNLEQGLWSY